MSEHDDCVQQRIKDIEALTVAYLTDSAGTRYINMDDLGTVLVGLAELQVDAQQHALPVGPGWEPSPRVIDGTAYVHEDEVRIIAMFAALEGMRGSLETVLANAERKLRHEPTMVLAQAPDGIPAEWLGGTDG